MHKLYIPEIGDKLVLTKDWEFTLHRESRNDTLFEYLGFPIPERSRWDDPAGEDEQVRIPAGAVLAVDRVYIRKGQSDYSSITFRWIGASTPARTESRSGCTYGGPVPVPSKYDIKIPKKQVRFWAKLGDANNIEFKPYDEP